MSLSLMNCQMIRVISSPSSSTTGLATLIFFMARNSLGTVAFNEIAGEAATIVMRRPRRKRGQAGLQPMRSDQPGLRFDDRLGRHGQRLHQPIDAVDDLEQSARPGRGEAALDDMVDERQELLPIAGDVDDDD